MTDPILCPSSRCQDGAILLGIVLPDGSVAFAKDRIEINAEFVEIARRGREPEKRFRFSSPCVRGACQQWTGERCGVIDGVVDQAARVGYEPQGALPECSIRPQCRWFGQSGADACRVCDQVVTDTLIEVEPEAEAVAV